MQTYLVKPSSDIDGAVLNDVIHDLRQRGLEIWVTKLKQKKKEHARDAPNSLVFSSKHA